MRAAGPRAVARAALVAAMLFCAPPLLVRPAPCLAPQAAGTSPRAGDEPKIVVAPGFLGQTLCRDAVASQTLNLCNEGGAPLIWSIGESGGPASDVPWLSEEPTGGAVEPGACQDVAVTFDAADLPPGPYTAQLIVASNDPDAPEVLVPVFLSVPEPVHDVAFSWQPAAPAVGEEVTFHASAGGDGPIEYTWDLGDGNAGSGAAVVHRYSPAGDYVVTLTGANPCGQAAAQHTLTVVPAHTWVPMVTR